ARARSLRRRRDSRARRIVAVRRAPRARTPPHRRERRALRCRARGSRSCEARLRHRTRTRPARARRSSACRPPCARAWQRRVRRTPRSAAQTPGRVALAGAGSATVGARDDLEIVADRIIEVHAAPAVVVVDLALAAMPRIGPVVEAARLNAPEDLVELRLA